MLGAPELWSLCCRHCAVAQGGECCLASCLFSSAWPDGACANSTPTAFAGVVRAIESRYASVEQMLFRALRLPVGQAISGSEDASEGSADDDNTDRESPTPLGSELLGRGRKSGLWGSLVRRRQEGGVRPDMSSARSVFPRAAACDLEMWH